MEANNHQQRDEKQAASFRRAVWLQVYLPLMVGAILVAALITFGLMATGRGGATTSGMADMALVALLMPVMILGVLALAAIVLLTVGVAKLIGWLPERTGIVQRIVARAPQLSDRIAGRVAQVVVVPKSAWGALEALWARRSGKD
jgi:hypothetical protein